MTQVHPNAGVRFPPPLIYFLGLVAAFLLNRAVPVWLAAPEPRWMFFCGLLAIAAGVVCAAAGMITFRRHGTAINPTRPATTVVTAGPYRFTRNPMYLGLAVFYIGVSLLIDTWWAFGLLPIVVFIVDRSVIAREERYLSAAFGDEYAAYRDRVRRWV